MSTPAVGPVAGTQLFIAPPGATPSPDTYVSINDISSLGDIAQAFTEIKVESIGSGDSYSIKGTQDFPNFALVLNRNDSDAGQVALKAAAVAIRGTLYNFKIVEVDGGTSVWQGEVFGYGPVYGGVNVLRTVKTSISIRPSSLVITLGS